MIIIINLYLYFVGISLYQETKNSVTLINLTECLVQYDTYQNIDTAFISVYSAFFLVHVK